MANANRIPDWDHKNMQPYTTSDPSQVTFTRQQLEVLEKVFPEVLEGDATDATLRHRIGQRSLIAWIRGRVR